MRSDYHIGLQQLRGLAALMVLLFHYNPHFSVQDVAKPLQTIFSYGYTGVDIFFALSGYVVAQSAQKFYVESPHGRVFSWLPFLTVRFLRIYLGVWPVLLLAFLMGVFFWDKTYTAKQLIQNVFLYTPHLPSNLLPTAWSLTYELYFYLLLAGVCVLKPVMRVYGMPVLIATIVLWNVYWLMVYPSRVYDGTQLGRFFLTPLTLDFLAGVWVYHNRDLFVNQRRLLWPLVLLLLFAYLIGSTGSVFANVMLFRMVCFGIVGISSLIIALILSDVLARSKDSLVGKWFIALGDCSFSLYLLHPILLDWFGYHRFHTIDNPFYKNMGTCLLPLGIILFAYGWYLLIEKPMYQAVIAKVQQYKIFKLSPN